MNVTWNRNANGYRLPTEAEWEYAARGGNGSPGSFVYAGSNNAVDVAVFSGNSSRSSQNVGTKAPNALGLYDMSGNVWEWCWDWHANYQAGAQTDPSGASSGFGRVRRGGSWNDPAQEARATNRDLSGASSRFSYLGFRVVR
jgi:formylglycine-generating enzyme required for sulfatase activity